MQSSRGLTQLIGKLARLELPATGSLPNGSAADGGALACTHMRQLASSAVPNPAASLEQQPAYAEISMAGVDFQAGGARSKKSSSKSRPLAPRTLERLAKQQRILSFAARIGMPTRTQSGGQLVGLPTPAEGDSSAAAAAVAEAPAEYPPLLPGVTGGEPSLEGQEASQGTRLAADKSQEEREKRWKKRPPVYPSYEVYEDWAASKAQQLQPARQYFAGLGLDPDTTVTRLFLEGKAAQALLMAEAPALQAAVDQVEEASTKQKAQKAKGKKEHSALCHDLQQQEKEAVPRKRGRQKKQSAEVAAAEAASLLAATEGPEAAGAVQELALELQQEQPALKKRGRRKREPAEERGAAAEVVHEGAAEAARAEAGPADPLAAAAVSPAAAAAAEPPAQPILQPPAEQLLKQQREQQQQEPVLPRLARVVDEWQAVLDESGLTHLTGPVGHLAAKWPGILVKAPKGGREAALARLRKLGALLHAGHEELAQLIATAPQILGVDPVDIAKRLEFLRLHAHLDRDVPAVLQLAPELLWANEGRLMGAIRVLVEHSRSASSYASAVKWHPQLLLAATPRRAEATLRTVGTLLPPGFDPGEVLRCRPQLLLARPRHLARNWEQLGELCSQVPAWQEDLDWLLAASGTAGAAPAELPPPGDTGGGGEAADPLQDSSRSSAGAAEDAQQAQHASEPGIEPGIAPYKAPPGSAASLLQGILNFRDKPKLSKAGRRAGGSSKAATAAKGPGREQYYSVAKLLDVRPDQLARLQFLLERHLEAASSGEEPLEQLLTMRPRAFERSFPGLAGWLEERAAQQAQQAVQQQQAEGGVGGSHSSGDQNPLSQAELGARGEGQGASHGSSRRSSGGVSQAGEAQLQDLGWEDGLAAAAAADPWGLAQPGEVQAQGSDRAATLDGGAGLTGLSRSAGSGIGGISSGLLTRGEGGGGPADAGTTKGWRGSHQLTALEEGEVGSPVELSRGGAAGADGSSSSSSSSSRRRRGGGKGEGQGAAGERGKRREEWRAPVEEEGELDWWDAATQAQ